MREETFLETRGSPPPETLCGEMRKQILPKPLDMFPYLAGPQFSSVAQSCPTLCHPMDCSTPVFPVHHQLPELAETHVL